MAYHDGNDSNEELDSQANPRLPVLLSGRAEESDTHTLAPFRRIAFEQLSRSGFKKGAPTVLELPEKPENEPVHPVPNAGKSSEKSVKPPSSKHASFAAPSEPYPITIPSGATTFLQIHAQTVNVYTMGSPQCETCKKTDVTSVSRPYVQPPAAKSSNNVTTSTQPLQDRPPWEAYRPPVHPDIPVDERYALLSSPCVYSPGPERQTDEFDRSLDDFPLADTAPPEFLDKGHLDAMHEADLRAHHHSNSDGLDSGRKEGSAVASGSACSQDEEDSFLLNTNPTVCPQGKEDCTCAPQYIELFKNAATYLYKHTRSLSQELFQAHVHVGERIERLSQDNAFNGGPTLPGSVHEFLQTETSQLLQDWAIAESKCSQYICDSILADVNQHAGAEASEGAAKGIPPDFFDSYGSESSDVSQGIGEGSSTSRHQDQCAEQFAELRKDLLSLTDRSVRIKRQWANLLDLCNKLDEVARAGGGADREDANCWRLPMPVEGSEDLETASACCR